jgi:D-3-phosphoglycerate dehydrogenase / 2-oxoglutarate reductase
MEGRAGMNILITEPENYSTDALALYKKAGNLDLLPKLGLPLSEIIGNYDVIVLRLQYAIDKELLEKATRLRYIICPTTGLDHIDEIFTSQKGIEIISLRGEISFLNSIPSTSEFTWALLLSLIKKIPAAAQHVTAGGWNRNLFKGNNLKGKKVGILGLGRVGRQVARFATAFGMEVMAYDTNALHVMPGVAVAADAASLFSWCQVLCIHIPAGGNDGFVSAELLQNLQPGSIVINTSRGSVWDEFEVVKLLQINYLSGVATDVLCGEINEASRLINPLLAIAGKHPNLIITPHIAGATYESMAATEDFVAKKFIGLLR